MLLWCKIQISIVITCVTKSKFGSHRFSNLKQERGEVDFCHFQISFCFIVNETIFFTNTSLF